MSDFPATGYLEFASRTTGEMKAALEALLAATRQLPGGKAAGSLTIASGVITPTGASHIVDTEASASTDDLTNLNQTNMPDGSVVILRTTSSARTVVMKHGAGGAGQMSLLGSADFAMTSTLDTLVLQRAGTLWQEVVRNTQAATVPTGTVFPFAGSSAPSGYLLCDGSAVSRTAFSALFALIGSTYGGGDGSTTFNVPNLTGRLPVGKAASGTFASLGSTGGQETLRAHTHGMGGATSFFADQLTGVQTNVALQAHTHTITSTQAGISQMNPYVVLNYVVKT
jgi:microcystin-dependent protein